MNDRAFGAYLGQYIGDALGTRYEFKNRVFVTRLVAKDCDANGFLPILGEGPFGLLPGQVTDDTEMASALARSLNTNGDFVAEDVANKYRSWFDSDPFDIGNATRHALNGAPRNGGESWFAYFQRSSQMLNSGSLSNGCLMRCSPIGIAGASRTDDWIIKSAKTDTSMTHPRHEPKVATAAYCLAMARLIRGESPGAAYDYALQFAKSENCGTVVQNLIDAKDHASPVAIEGGKVVDGDHACMGYIGVALQFSFYQLLHCRTFEEGLLNTIKLGGDTDTTGCICGALLGARFGRETIPKPWIQTVLGCKPNRYEKYKLVKVDDYESIVNGLFKT